MSPAWRPLHESLVVLLLSIILSSTCIWLVTGLVVLAWRNASAASRHRLLGVSMLVVLISPLLVSVLPIPRWTKWDGLRSPVAKVNQSANGRQIDQMDIAIPVTHIHSIASVDPDHQRESPLRVEETSPEPGTTAGSIASPITMPTEVSAPTELVATSPRVTARLPLPSWEAVLAISLWVWIVGAVFSMVWLTVSLQRVNSWLRLGILIDSGVEADRCRELCREFSIRTPIRIVLSPETLVPFVSGILRPVLVLPTGFGQWSADRLQVVMAHELMHVRRGDVLWQMIGRCCLIPLWFHPLGWIALWRLRIECEHACDDAVLLSGEKPCDYANHLVEIAAGIRQRTQRLPSHVVAMAKHSPVEQRVRSILNPAVPRHPVSRLRTWCVCLGMAATVLFVAMISPTLSEAKLKSSPETKTEAKSSNDPVQAEAPAEAAKRRIEAFLDQATTVDFNDGTLFVDVLKDQVRKHRTPISLDEWSFVERRALFDRVSAFQASNAKLRDVLKSICEPILGPKQIRLDLHELHGGLEVAAKGGRVSDHYSDDCDCGNQVIRMDGMVQDARGAPVRNAMIEIRNGYQLTLAISDDAGKFTVETDYIYFFDLRVTATDETTGHSSAWWHRRFKELPKPAIVPVLLVVKPPRQLTVQVVDREGVVVPNAKAAVAIGDSPIDECLAGRTDDNGLARFSLPDVVPVKSIFALASGKGFDFISYDERSTGQRGDNTPTQPNGIVTVKLTGARSVTLNARNEENQPVSGVRFIPWIFDKRANKSRTEHSSFNCSIIRFFDRAITNQNGVAVFDWIPEWQTDAVTFWHDSQDYVHRRVTFDSKTSPGGQVSVKLEKPVTISGCVFDPNGQPSFKTKITALGVDYSHDTCGVSTMTDKDGKYSLQVFPRQVYLLLAKSSNGLQAASRDEIVVYPGQPVPDIDIPLRPSVRVFGRVTMGQNAVPVKGELIQIFQYGKVLQRPFDAVFPKPTDQGPPRQPRARTFADMTTDADGRFEFRVSSGTFGVLGPQRNRESEIEITDQAEIEINFHSNGKEWNETRRIGSNTRGQPAPSSRLAVDRYRAALAEAKLRHKNVLISFHQTSPWLIERTELDLHRNFQTIEVLTGRELSGAKQLAAQFNTDLPVTNDQHLLVVADENGTVVGIVGPYEVTGDNLQTKLADLLRQHLPVKFDAKKVLADGMRQARQENKRILIQPTSQAIWGTYLSPALFLFPSKSIWDRDYIGVVIDDSWLNFELAMKPLRKATQGRLPTIAILDPAGKVRRTWAKNENDLFARIEVPAVNDLDSDEQGRQSFNELAKQDLQQLIEQDLADQVPKPEPK